LVQMSDMIDLVKAGGTGAVGIGTWYVEISQLLQLSISTACLCYLCAKIYFLFKNQGK